jgi:hypothetical protein
MLATTHVRVDRPCLDVCSDPSCFLRTARKRFSAHASPDGCNRLLLPEVDPTLEPSQRNSSVCSSQLITDCFKGMGIQVDIALQCREQERQVYYCAVFEAKKEIPDYMQIYWLGA